MLIATYGTFWNPDAVHWGARGRANPARLIGTTWYRGREIEIDVFPGVGVYVLYKDYQVVYVGKAAAETSTLGVRLRDHLTDRLEGRWDSFSFYLVNRVNQVEPRLANAPASRLVEPKETAETIEALLIDLANPPLNRRRESIAGATELEQKQTRVIKSNIDYLDELVSKLDAFMGSGGGSMPKK